MEEITVSMHDKSNQDIHVWQIAKHNDNSEGLPEASGGIALGMDVMYCQSSSCMS
jgi:hypothetical protein